LVFSNRANSNSQLAIGQEQKQKHWWLGIIQAK
jgi:hypothetical protein